MLSRACDNYIARSWRIRKLLAINGSVAIYRPDRRQGLTDWLKLNIFEMLEDKKYSGQPPDPSVPKPGIEPGTFRSSV